MADSRIVPSNYPPRDYGGDLERDTRFGGDHSVQDWRRRDLHGCSVREASRAGGQGRSVLPGGAAIRPVRRKSWIGSVNWKTYGKIDPLTIIRLTRLMWERRSDVIHTHLSTASLLGASRRNAQPAQRGPRPRDEPATCYRRSTAVIAVSEAVKSYLSSQEMDERKVHVVENGVDLDYFQPMRARRCRRSARSGSGRADLWCFRAAGSRKRGR